MDCYGIGFPCSRDRHNCFPLQERSGFPAVQPQPGLPHFRSALYSIAGESFIFQQAVDSSVSDCAVKAMVIFSMSSSILSAPIKATAGHQDDGNKRLVIRVRLSLAISFTSSLNTIHTCEAHLFSPANSTKISSKALPWCCSCSSSMLPWATSLPLCMKPILSHSFSTSLMV